MIVIGITGSLATGKSEVAKILKKKGAHVFDADRVARDVIRKGTPVYGAILKIFGRGYLSADGRINRKKLAAHVFNHPKDLDKLNTLIHPAVIVDCIRRIHGVKRKKGILVLDVPLLFESKMQNLADVTVVVSATPSRRAARAIKKGISKKLGQKILKNQWPLKKKERLADFVVYNNGSKAELKRKVLRLLDEIKTKTNGGIE